MPDTDVIAASSTAQATPVTDLNQDQYTHWRKTGETPKIEATPKADSTPAPKESSEVEAEAETKTSTASEAESTSQKPKRDNAETRIKELLANNKRLTEELTQLKAPKTTEKTESSPVKAEPQYTRPKPKDSDTNSDGSSKYATFEDYMEDLADWKAEQRIAQNEREKQNQAEARALQSKIEEARGRYTDADSVIVPTSTAVFSDQQIPAVLKQVVNDSPVLVDLLYVMGSNAEDFNAWIALAKSDPGKALRKVVLMEKLVEDELAGKAKEVTRADNGQFVSSEKKKVSSAQKFPPPKEVSTTAAPPEDAVESAKNSGDFRAYREAMNKKEIAARKTR